LKFSAAAADRAQIGVIRASADAILTLVEMADQRIPDLGEVSRNQA
jgi:hypothetical protein